MAYLFAEDRADPGAYHVWGKALEGIWLFRDDEDRVTFEWLVNRHLSAVPQLDGRRRPYVCLRDEVRLCARNLLWTHFHLILWQRVNGGIDQLMRRVLNAYTRYYNDKYGRAGSLFPGPYRARLIEGRKSFMWRVAYVQNNHKREGLDWRFSTHRLFVAQDPPPSWLELDRTLTVFGGRDAYSDYMKRFLTRADLDRDLRIDGPDF